MRAYTLEDIRHCFATSGDFNELFDAFEAALAQGVKDIEPYRQLFWNHALAPDEVRLFGEKLAAVFPELAYDVFLWLARMFEATHATSDNYELAFLYYRKAAAARPHEPDPYLDACDCYEPDLNIPPLPMIIEFVQRGIQHVASPSPLYKRLARLHDLAGEAGRAEECRRAADDHDISPPEPSA